MSGKRSRNKGNAGEREPIDWELIETASRQLRVLESLGIKPDGYRLSHPFEKLSRKDKPNERQAFKEQG